MSSVSGLIVVRNHEQGGTPDFVRCYKPGFSYGDDYNFEQEEFPELDARVVLDELKLACRTKGDEWAKNRIKFPDFEFLLFGKSNDRADYRAFKCSFVLSGWKHGEPVIVLVSEVDEMAVACIGAPEVATAITWNETLRAALQASVPPLGCDKTLGSFLGNLEPPNMAAVESRLVEIVHNVTDSSVGGRLMVAAGGSNGIIWLRPARVPDP